VRGEGNGDGKLGDGGLCDGLAVSVWLCKEKGRSHESEGEMGKVWFMGVVEFMVEKMVVQWRSDEWWLKFGGLLVGLYRATDIIMEKFYIHTPDDLTLSPNSQEKLVRNNPPDRIFQIKK
jgi:hypothetical protein